LTNAYDGRDGTRRRHRSRRLFRAATGQQSKRPRRFRGTVVANVASESGLDAAVAATGGARRRCKAAQRGCIGPDRVGHTQVRARLFQARLGRVAGPAGGGW